MKITLDGKNFACYDFISKNIFNKTKISQTIGCHYKTVTLQYNTLQYSQLLVWYSYLDWPLDWINELFDISAQAMNM